MDCDGYVLLVPSIIDEKKLIAEEKERDNRGINMLIKWTRVFFSR
jgi:hypothetical protein